MSIAETYNGMLSCDLYLLQSLLDDGDTIIAVSEVGYGLAFRNDSGYVFQVGSDLHHIGKIHDALMFLIPVRLLNPVFLEHQKSANGGK